MSDTDEVRPGAYVLGETRETDDTWLEAQDALWTSGGFGGPALSDFLGLSSPYRVTGKQALEQAAVLICLDVLSQDISKAPLRLKEMLPKGGTRDVLHGDHPLAEMLALEPNERHTWVEFIGMLVFHLGLSSNSYAYVRRNSQGDPTALIPVMPVRVEDLINERTGEVFYGISAGTAHEAGLLRSWYITPPERDVIHIRQRMLDGFWGYSTLIAGGRTLSMGRGLSEYERNLFSEDALIRGVFVRGKDAGVMTDETFRRMKSQLKKLMQRVRDHGDPILLEDNVDYKPLAMKANEAEMGKALDKQIESICQLWRIPPHKAMHFAGVKYENLATLEKQYVKDTLIPLCGLIEARLAKTLLTRKERLRYKFEFDRDAMAINDEVAERERLTKMAERGGITINEWRTEQGYNPAPWGDVRILPVNNVLLDLRGNVVATGAKPDDEPEEPANAPPTNEDEDPKKGLRLIS